MTSTNPVVQNALNVVARNAKTCKDVNGKTIRIGDMVTIDGVGKRKVVDIKMLHGEGPYVFVKGEFRPYKSYIDVSKS